MDRVLCSYQGRSAHYRDDDDLRLPEKEFDLYQSNLTEGTGSLTLLNDDFDATLSHNDDNPMLCEGDFVLPQGVPAQHHDNLSFLEEELELDIPHDLPEDALLTTSTNFFHADGHEETYLTLLNTPIDNYVAPKINDGHEFAIGGDPKHILKCLNQQFESRPQERWHVIVVPEENLSLVGAPRCSYPLVPGMADASSRPFDLPGRDDGTRSVYSPANQYSAGRGYTQQINQVEDVYDGLMDGQPIEPPHVYGNFGFFEPGQPQQNIDLNDDMMNSGSVELLAYLFDDQGLCNQPDHIFNQTASQPFQFTTAYYNPRLECIEPEQSQHREDMWLHRRQDAATIEADTRWGNYSGTDLCRWCGRHGHEAVQCIRWDPDHFDKLVCVACNNKKHVIDECSNFANLSDEAKAKLLLVDGAKKPGVRSFFWPWVRFLMKARLLFTYQRPHFLCTDRFNATRHIISTASTSRSIHMSPHFP